MVNSNITIIPSTTATPSLISSYATYNSLPTLSNATSSTSCSPSTSTPTYHLNTLIIH